ncbi:MAG: TRAP transporter large permease [Rhodospirillaceae bacterium]|jgi:C4-dicarboxylate transporter, DctM subunit|nr:TRAP transporter large permease [Rhodospirillaceae bacterium]MBT7955136.1 TRAP transporter large permease [Rhodospirillaceae bacterium]
MDPVLISVLGIIGMFALVILHVPIGVAMATAGAVGYAVLQTSWKPAVSLFATELSGVISSPDLAVVPLFLLMGSFAGVSGLSADIYRLAYAFIGHRRGGLALATIGGCAGFGAVCGSSIATAATMGRVALPEMLSRGYSPKLASGSVAAGGTLGMLIPPSVIMVIYAFITEKFVITLFITALIPALLALFGHLIAIWVQVIRNPEIGPAGDKVNWAERLTVLKKSWGVMFLLGAVIGGIYGGVFTVVEAAALGAGLAFLFTVGRGKLNWETLGQVLKETAAASSMLYVMVTGASIFSFFISASKMPVYLVENIQAMELSPIIVVYAVVIVYLILGSIFDSIAAMLITLPFVFPLIIGMGYDAYWWGVILVMVMEVGLITPPIGMNVFVIYGVADNIPLKTIFSGIFPFFYADIIRINILIWFPIISLWLPQALGMNLN